MARKNSIRILVAGLLFIFAAPVLAVGTAVTKGPAKLQIKIGENGSAVKNVPAGIMLEILTDDGDTLTVKDASGLTGTISKTDVTVQQDQKDSGPPATPTPASPLPVAIAEAPAPAAVPPATGVDYKQINEALGVPLFAGNNLWEENADTVAAHLGLPKESQTDTQASYRAYTGPKVQVLGARPYSVALYAHESHPDFVSMVFANKGDFEGLSALSEKNGNLTVHQELEKEKKAKKDIKNFGEAVREDARVITETLTGLLGEPVQTQYGVSQAMRESVRRWDWQGHSFLLASPRGEYTSLKIVPQDLADGHGRAARISDADLRALLQQRLVKRDNADVVVGQIPMVNQGPKGFCVPATWERYLRYLEIPADMYVLAMAGGTRLGGGTSLNSIRANMDTYIQLYGRRIETVTPDLGVLNVSKFIDKGLPLMWACYVSLPMDKEISERSAERAQTTDWAAYILSLKSIKKKAKDHPFRDPDAGHLRMIVGYNAKTGELAISDSWGEKFQERWLTVEEAEDISQGDLTVIKW